MSRLGGRYVGSVLVELPESRLDELGDAAQRIDAIGLKLERVEVTDVDEREGEPVGLDIVGPDRPGIVHEATAVLAALDVNIEELTTTIEASALSGAPLFRAKVKMLVPTTVSDQSVREALEGISDEIMVDFSIEPADS